MSVIGPPPSAAAPLTAAVPYPLEVRSSLRCGARSFRLLVECDCRRPVGQADGEEALVDVGVPDLAPLGDERRRRHRVVPAAVIDRRVEVGDLARMVRVADVEYPQARDDERTRHDPRLVATRNGAVVPRVALSG